MSRSNTMELGPTSIHRIAGNLFAIPEVISPVSARQNYVTDQAFLASMPEGRIDTCPDVQLPQDSVFGNFLGRLGEIIPPKFALAFGVAASAGLFAVGAAEAKPTTAANTTPAPKAAKPTVKIIYSETQYSQDAQPGSFDGSGTGKILLQDNGKWALHNVSPTGMTKTEVKKAGCEVVDPKDGTAFINSGIMRNGQEKTFNDNVKPGETFCLFPDGHGYKIKCKNDVWFKVAKPAIPPVSRQEVTISQYPTYAISVSLKGSATATAKAQAYCKTPSGGYSYAEGKSTATSSVEASGVGKGKTIVEANTVAENNAKHAVDAKIQTGFKGNISVIAHLRTNATANARVHCQENKVATPLPVAPTPKPKPTPPTPKPPTPTPAAQDVNCVPGSLSVRAITGGVHAEIALDKPVPATVQFEEILLDAKGNVLADKLGTPDGTNQDVIESRSGRWIIRAVVNGKPQDQCRTTFDVGTPPPAPATPPPAPATPPPAPATPPPAPAPKLPGSGPGGVIPPSM